MEKIEVVCIQDAVPLEPLSFFYRGQLYSIEDTGREWADEAGQHWLCRVNGGQVVELIRQQTDSSWWVKWLPGTHKPA